ncbi:hypothetical protein BDV26DRAFT_233222 [Aspergillus bertholletiae]|uniref:Uncharacterized protein n=1 Tax=Aspergillus bertholletiae TaxID=1226010 RepID=A0A5N7B5M5_9EURO|nr:hypothetical protein BDV26DRAFT_233222 [Aspergillus bertholletiae]
MSAFCRELPTHGCTLRGRKKKKKKNHPILSLHIRELRSPLTFIACSSSWFILHLVESDLLFLVSVVFHFVIIPLLPHSLSPCSFPVSLPKSIDSLRAAFFLLHSDTLPSQFRNGSGILHQSY